MENLEQAAEQLFGEALDLEGDERRALLDRECSGQPALRSRVEALLEDNDRLRGFLSEPALGVARNSDEGISSDGLPQGTKLGRYSIIERLGKGGMGEVYLALDPALERKVAIKLLPIEVTGDAHRVRRFTQEAKAASALSHPNIVSIYGFGECEFGQYLVMELIIGRRLRSLGPRPLEPSLVAAIGVQIARALEATHASGIVHRDLKPDNIMVRPDGLVKVLDFGVARLSGATSNSMDTVLTLPGTTLGTPEYMSPEQVRGEWLTNASDVFSLGIVLYELVTGKHPFEADSKVGFMHSILSRPAIRPSRLNLAIAPWLESLLLRMLEKDPQRRCAAADVVQAFGERELEHPVISPAPAPPWRRIVARRKELAELNAALQGATHRQSLMVCISGEAGLGKTTLIEEFLQDVSARSGALIAAGRCSERLADAGAYLPVLEMLESLLNGVERESAAAAIKSLAPTWHGQLVSGPAAASPSQEKLKLELSALLQELSLQQPLVVFLDDIHWADVSTIDLLLYISRQMDRMRLLLVTTFRSAEIHASHHPFLQLHREMQTRRLSREIALEFFSVADIREYLDFRFPGHSFPDELAQKLAQRTEGNPLFVADLLRYLQEREAIVLRDGSWNLTGPLARLLTGMPDTVLSMVQRGMEQLGDEERRLLAAASVQGYDFDTAVLAKALAIDAAELEDKLDKLERQSGFLRLIDEHELPDRTLTLRYRFVHVLYQDALYGSLRPARRASLSRSVAEALLHFYGTQAGRIAAQLALLLEAARDFSRAAEYCLSASQNALMLFASSEAEALARRGIASIRSTPDTDEHARIELGLQQLLALALRNLKTYSGREGTAIQRRVLELAERLNDYETQFVVHYHVAWFFNTHQEFSQALVEAGQCLRIAELHDDPRMRAAAHLTLGDIMTHQGRLLECRRHLETVNETYRASDAPYYAQRIGTDPKANANGDLGLVLFYLGFVDQAMETLRRAGVAAQAARNPIALGVARICEILGYKHHGIGKLLREATEDLEAICIKNEFLSSMLFFVNFGKGLVLASNGKPAEGLVKIDEAIAQVRDIEFTCAVPIMASGKGEVMRLAGQAELGVQFLDEQLAVCEKYGQHAEVPDILRVKGECLLGTLKDSPSVRLETEECFRQSMAAAARMGARLCELEAANELAGLLDQSGRQQEATDVLAPVYSWFTEGFDAPALKRAKALLERLK